MHCNKHASFIKLKAKFLLPEKLLKLRTLLCNMASCMALMPDIISSISRFASASCCSCRASEHSALKRKEL